MTQLPFQSSRASGGPVEWRPQSVMPDNDMTAQSHHIAPAPVVPRPDPFEEMTRRSDTHTERPQKTGRRPIHSRSFLMGLLVGMALMFLTLSYFPAIGEPAPPISTETYLQTIQDPEPVSGPAVNGDE